MFIFKLKYKSQVWVWKATEKFLSLVRSWCAVWGRWARLWAPPGGIGASRSAAMAPGGAGQGPPSSDTFPWSQRHILRQQRHSPSSHPHPAPLASVCFSLLVPPSISTYGWSCCTSPLPLSHFLWTTAPLGYPKYPFLCQHILLLLLHFMSASCYLFRRP